MAPAKLDEWTISVRDRETYLLSEGIDSEAIAHMKADAAFSPPPHRRKTEEIQTDCRRNSLGKAPRKGLSDRTNRQGLNSLHTNSEDFAEGRYDSYQ